MNVEDIEEEYKYDVSKWHTWSVSVKVTILHSLFVVSLLSGLLWSSYTYVARIADNLKTESHKFNMGDLIIVLSFTVQHLSLATIFYPTHSIFKSVRIFRFICLFNFWFRFISFYIIMHPDKYFTLIGILGFSIQSFCMAETYRIRGLYNDTLVSEIRYFKFVMAASLSTAYYLLGFQSIHFWIVLFTCVCLNFLYGNYFNPSDANRTTTFQDQTTQVTEQPSSTLCPFSEFILSFFVHCSLRQDDLLGNIFSKIKNRIKRATLSSYPL